MKKKTWRVVSRATTRVKLVRHLPANQLPLVAFYFSLEIKKKYTDADISFATHDSTSPWAGESPFARVSPQSAHRASTGTMNSTCRQKATCFTYQVVSVSQLTMDEPQY